MTNEVRSQSKININTEIPDIKPNPDNPVPFTAAEDFKHPAIADDDFETVDIWVEKPKDTLCKNPCCCLKIKLDTAIKWVYIFGMIMDVIYFTLCLSYEIIVANKHLHTIQENIDWSLVNLNFAQDIQIVVGLAIFFCVVSFIADILLARSADTFRQTVGRGTATFWVIATILLILIKIVQISIFSIAWELFKIKNVEDYHIPNNTPNSDDRDSEGHNHEATYSQDQVELRMHHHTIILIALGLMAFTIMFLLIRIWFLFIVLAFKKRSSTNISENQPPWIRGTGNQGSNEGELWTLGDSSTVDQDYQIQDTQIITPIYSPQYP